MNCPLQNIKVLQSIHQKQSANNCKSEHQTKNCTEELDYSNSVCEQLFENPTPFFIRQEDKAQQSNNYILSSNSDELFKYLQHNQSNSQGDDYSLQLRQLKERLVQIEQMSEKEILRLKRQLQEQKKKNRQCRMEVQSIGVNTEQDYKDEEIRILKDLLRQQSLLNKQLLKQSIKSKENIYSAINITRN